LGISLWKKLAKKKSRMLVSSVLFLWRNSPTRARSASFLTFQDHTQWHITDGRTSLDEGSARRKNLQRLIYTYHIVCLPCHAAKDFDRVVTIWITQCGHISFTHTMPCPFRAPTISLCKPFFKATARYGLYVLTSAQVRFFPTTTRNFTIGNSDFSGYTRTFTKDTAWYVLISLYLTTHNTHIKQWLAGALF
jgi:hypothetical protein